MKKLNPANRVWVYRLLMVALFPISGYAQEQKDSIADKVHQLDAVTVTARRMPAKITSTTSVQVFRKEDLKNLGLQNIGDAVKRFAGAVQYGGYRCGGSVWGLSVLGIRRVNCNRRYTFYGCSDRF